MKKELIIIFIIVFFLPKIKSQYIFDHYTKEDGLLDNYVEEVFECSRGFQWIITHKGLNRYDGVSMKNIIIPKEKRPAFLLNDLRAIDEDSQGNLWLGSMGGVTIYSPRFNTFSYFNSHYSRIRISNDIIQDIVVVNDNDMWVATQNGLNRISLQDSTNVVYHPDSLDFEIIGNYVYDLLYDSQKRLWFVTNSGVGLYSYKQSAFIPVDLDLEIETNENVSVRCIYEDSKHNIWLGIPKMGVFVLRAGSSSFERFDLKIDNIKTIIFSSICEDVHGKIWISTFVDGLIIVDPNTNDVEIITEDTRTPYNISGSSIDRIKKDSYGNMWLATHGGGISVYRPLKWRVEHYTKKNNGVSGRIVSCFEEEDSSVFWIGTDGGGINRFAYATKIFEPFNTSNGLPSNAVLDLEQIDNTYMAIATWNGGLSVFNKTLNTFSNYYYNKVQSENNIQQVQYDSVRNYIWCATQNRGIQIFDFDTKQFMPQDSLHKIIPKELDNQFAIDFCFLDDSSIMIANTFCLSLIKGETVRTFDSSNVSPSCLTCAFPSDLFFSNDKKLYVASQNGLFVYDEKCFWKILPENNKMTNLRAIAEDAHGNLWITSDKSLFKYSPALDIIEDMGQKWGIPSMDFFYQSAQRLGNGLLFFGGGNGFIIIDENDNLNYNINPHLYITDLYVHSNLQLPNGEGAILKQDISYLDTLILNHDEAFISIDFCALNFIDSKKTSYRYFLDGFDKQWTSSLQNKRITYTNIPQGEYLLKIQSTNSDGTWSDELKQLHIKVLPPWWKTLWFQAIAVFAIVAIIIIYIKFRERKIKNINRYLEIQVASRTEELQQINEELVSQKETIQRNYQELKDKQLVIQLKNDELQETIHTKDKLIAVIGHDFRTPLTALNGLIKSLSSTIKQKLNETEQKIFDAIGKSSNTLLSQMIDVLQWSSSKQDKVKFDPIHVNIETLINDSLSLVGEMAKAKKIQISLLLQYSTLTYVDARMISVVLRNIITNSIKFTNDNGTIEIIAKENNDALELVVKDSGVGMSQKKLDEILNEERTVSEETLSGFGLQLCKAFIDMNSGSMYVESQENEGTQVHIFLPKGNKSIIPHVDKKYDYFSIEYNNEEELELKPDSKSMLIIDDDASMVEYMKSIFEKKYSVSVSFDGQDGLKKANTILPDIILSDVDMPYLNGNELCKILKSNSFTSHIPIILISAKKMDSDQLAGLKSGADDFIIKPFNEELLRVKVEKLVDQISERTYVGDPILEKLKITLPESIEDKFLKKTTQTIVDRISDPSFSVETLADEVGMSRSQLYRKFKAVLGVSPMDYIKNLRLQKSLKLLMTEKYRISEIAYEVGFSDYKYFTTCFTKTFGSSPTNYLAKHKKNKDQQ